MQNAFTPGATDCAPWDPPPDYVQRVRTYYRRASAGYDQPFGTMWRVIGDNYRQPIHETLIGGTDAAVAEILGNPGSHDLNYGMDPLSKRTIDTLQATPSQHYAMADSTLAALVRLSGTIGARRVWNPASAMPVGHSEPAALLDEIDRALGRMLPYPNSFPGEYGLQTNRGVIGRRVPFAIHHAWLLSNLAAFVGDTRIVEIGGGLGRTGLYARALGLTDYTIVDIPLSTVSQAGFLGAALGPDAVWFDGEPPRPGAIRLVPPDWINGAKGSFGVTYNANSLTEMSQQQACDYVAFAARHSRVLLSINHEANAFRVFDLPSQLGIPCHYQRALSALLPGYVEECLFFRKAS